MHVDDEAAPSARPEAPDTGAIATGPGDPAAGQRLFEELYAELKRLAGRELQRHAGAPLSPTTLLHEAYLNLAGRDAAVFADRARFMSYAAKAMRGLVIDQLREQRAQKRGGDLAFTSIDTTVAEGLAAPERLESVSDAIEALAVLDAALAELVDLRFFGGMSFADIALLRGVSERTVQRDWKKARLLLHRELKPEVVGSPPVTPPKRKPAWN